MENVNSFRHSYLLLCIILLILVHPTYKIDSVKLDIFNPSQLTFSLNIRLDSINNINESIPADSIIDIIINNYTERFYINGTIINNNITNIISNNNITLGNRDKFTIIDYERLLNWTEISNYNNTKAINLPNYLKDFINNRLEIATNIFNSSEYELFKEQWVNFTLDINDVRIRITKDNLINDTNVIGNPFTIEFNRFEFYNGNLHTVFKIYDQSNNNYIYELLERDNILYHGKIINIDNNSNKKSIDAPIILNYTINIDSSKLEPGNYTIYAKIDTGLGFKFESERVNAIIDIPASLKGFDYIKLLNRGYNDISFNDIRVSLNAINTLIGIKEIINPSINLTNYELYSKIFEIRVYNYSNININITLKHIPTTKDIKLIRYDNNTFEVNNDSIRMNNTNSIAGSFNKDGIFFIAFIKNNNQSSEDNQSNNSNNGNQDSNNNNQDNRDTRIRISNIGNTIINKREDSYPIIVRSNEPTTIFNIDLAKYQVYLKNAKITLNEPTTTLYMIFSIPESISYKSEDILTYFKLESSMRDKISNIELTFNLGDSFSNLHFYKLINNIPNEIPLNIENGVYKAVSDSVGLFVLTGSKVVKNNIESKAIFPITRSDITNNVERNIIIDNTINNNVKHRFNLYGYELDIQFDGSINVVDIIEEENGILLKIKESNDNNILITLPRAVIDAKQINGEDAKLLVLVDGTLADYKEVKVDQYRVLDIDITPNVKEIRIIGSRVVPEFNALIIIVMTFITLVIVSRIYAIKR